MLQNIIFFLALIVISIASIHLKKLTVPGTLTGVVCAIFIFLAAGFTGVFLLGLFFVLGTGATYWMKEKKTFLDKEHSTGQRDMGQVLANGGIAGMLCIFALIFRSHEDILILMMAGSLSAATADTLSSELGMVYGKRFFHVLNFRSGEKGMDGVISIEGTLLGVAGSALISFVYVMGYGWSDHFWWILIGGTIGNIVDSIIGDAFERRSYISNNAVNLINTLAGALVAGSLSQGF